MVYDVQTFLWTLWGLLFRIVQMIPYNHPKQELLVNFLKTLRRKKVGTATLYVFLPSHKIIPTHYIQVCGKANSNFILVGRANMGKPSDAKSAFERGIPSYVSSSHN